MTRLRLRPMPAGRLVSWRDDRRDDAPLPPLDAQDHEALEILVDDTVVGRLLIAEDRGVPPGHWVVRALETTLASGDTETWALLLTRIADHARSRGAGTLDTAVHPLVSPASAAAGYRPTATLHAKRLDADAAFQEDRRVSVRAMDAAERAAFVADARTLMTTGALGEVPAGAPGWAAGGLAARLDAVVADRAPDELLMTGTVDGAPVGRVWATLVTVDDATDFVGHVIEVFDGHRGQGLTPSFLGALAREVRHLGVRDVHVRVPEGDHRVRRWFLDAGVAISDVQVRRDLGAGG
jgi:GNAT superfamily N-acetyltransferase